MLSPSLQWRGGAEAAAGKATGASLDPRLVGLSEVLPTSHRKEQGSFQVRTSVVKPGKLLILLYLDLSVDTFLILLDKMENTQAFLVRTEGQQSPPGEALL